MAVVQLTDATFEQEVLKADMPVIVDFYATWCGPCKMMSPIVDELGTEYAGKVKVCKIDVDENPETSQKYGVMSIPTILFVKKGAVADKTVGVQSKDKMQDKLDALLK